MSGRARRLLRPRQDPDGGKLQRHALRPRRDQPGIVSRGQLLRWGRDHMRYRLRGATDEETKEVLKVARELITGVPAVRSTAWAPR